MIINKPDFSQICYVLAVKSYKVKEAFKWKINDESYSLFLKLIKKH